MSVTSSLLLELLSLLQGRRDWPGDKLADRLEVSGRTSQTGVDRLRFIPRKLPAKDAAAYVEHEPPELVEHLRALAFRLARAAREAGRQL